MAGGLVSNDEYLLTLHQIESVKTRLPEACFKDA
jgi:hypothetical protein